MESRCTATAPGVCEGCGDRGPIQQTLKDIERGFIAEKSLSRKQKCIFLDRDGTINQYRGLVYKEEDFELEPCAVQAVKRINQSGRLGIVITNQPVVARGLCGIEDVENIHRKLSSLLGKEGAFLDDILFCPSPGQGIPGESGLQDPL